MKLRIMAYILIIFSLLISSCQKNEETQKTNETNGPDETTQTDETNQTNEPEGDSSMTKLLYQGHGSFRLTSKDGTVIYVDPYAGEGYDLPADMILVTHQHNDHNQVKLVTQKKDCALITNADALDGGKYNTFSKNGMEIEAVEAGNKNHNPKECVGYIITIDGIKVYAAGDTSKTDQMDTFDKKSIDYALLPCDGVYNMDLKEAAECAEIIGAAHNIPIHMKPGEWFDQDMAGKFDAPNKLVVKAGEEITLKKKQQ